MSKEEITKSAIEKWMERGEDQHKRLNVIRGSALMKIRVKIIGLLISIESVFDSWQWRVTEAHIKHH